MVFVEGKNKELIRKYLAGERIVREGDFVLYGSFYYEIVTLNETKEIFGQVDHKMEISAKCIRARKGLFDGS